MRKSLLPLATLLIGAAASLPAAPADDLARLRERLARDETSRRREFAAVAARRLPPIAVERLQRAQAAYEAGQGRAARLLSAASARDAAEAQEILSRIKTASLREPISAGELKVKAPALRAPGLPTGDGHAGLAPAALQDGFDAPIGQVPAVLREAAAGL